MYGIGTVGKRNWQKIVESVPKRAQEMLKNKVGHKV